MDICRVGDFEAAAAIRRAVFMEEQGYTNEFDEIDRDPACIHLTLEHAAQPVGCARVYPQALQARCTTADPTPPVTPLDADLGPDEIFLLGRVAVLPTWRHQGFAEALIHTAADEARHTGAQLIKLHAQEHVVGLYERAGYQRFGAVDYADEGQPHIWMVQRLSSYV